jgi:hypothetical protein
MRPVIPAGACWALAGKALAPVRSSAANNAIRMVISLKNWGLIRLASDS